MPACNEEKRQVGWKEQLTAVGRNRSASLSSVSLTPIEKREAERQGGRKEGKNQSSFLSVPLFSKASVTKRKS